MRTGQWFTVVFLFVTLLAEGLQCQDPDRHGRRPRRNQRRLRSHHARRDRTTTDGTPSKEGAGRSDGSAPFITAWPVNPSNSDGIRSDSAPDNNKTDWDDEASNETQLASPTLSTHQWHTRLRSKQARLFGIQMQILQKLGLRRQPNVTSPIIPSGLPIPDFLQPSEPERHQGDRVFYDENDVVERYQFLRPSCELPRRADNTWNDGNAFRLLFQLSSTMKQPNINITTADLRLFKKAIPVHQEQMLDKRAKTRCNCQSNGSPGSRPMRRLRNGGRRRRQGGETQVYVQDHQETEKIRITVFKYNKPVRHGRRERKMLVDSIMVEKSFEGWQRLDIKQAVNAWIKNPSNNFGLLIQVEDMDQNDLDATQVFGPMNCSADTTLPVIPLTSAFLEGGVLIPSQNQSTPYLEISSVQSFNIVRRHRREAPSKCELKHRTISIEDLGLKSASPNDQLKIGYCQGSCGKRTLCRATSWETKMLTESSRGSTSELSVYNKLSATSCSCHQESQT